MHHAQMKPAGDTTETNLNVSQGIVSGFVTQYATALDVAPGSVMDAVRAAGVELMVDTTRQKGTKTRDRPTDPSMRCIAMTRKDFARVLAEVQGGA